MGLLRYSDRPHWQVIVFVLDPPHWYLYLYLYLIHLIGRMLDPQSELRPSATEILAYSEEKDLVDYERTQDNYEAQTLSCLFNQHSEPNNPPYPMSFESEESM